MTFKIQGDNTMSGLAKYEAVGEEHARRMEWEQVGAPCVYFISAGPFVKIGKCSGHPAARLTQLQTGCPFRMNLEAYLMGGRSLERRLHGQWSEYRVLHCGEWFRLEGELATFVEQLGISQTIGRAWVEVGS